MITSSGRVEQRVIELPGHTEEQLATIHQRVNAAMADQTPSVASERLQKSLDELPRDMRMPLTQVVATLLDMVTTDPSNRIVVAGVPNLTRYGQSFEMAIQPVLEALEEQVVLLRLLGETASTDEVTVRIGQENPYEPLQTTSLVTTTYGDPNDAWANLGVVGPTRMDYPSTIASVRAVARYVGRFLSEG